MPTAIILTSALSNMFSLLISACLKTHRIVSARSMVLSFHAVFNAKIKFD